ncbi:MAG: universal stress protein [Flavobacteriaceae bacterium]|nr:universal stress protein [Flavobacteriaceae bacterium]
MKKIIVPVDFSEHSEYALKAAASIAKKHQAEILVLHMLEIGAASISESTLQQQETTLFYLKLAEKNFKNFLKKPYLEAVKVTPIVKHYIAFKEVNNVAEEYNADLIVMGSHGASGMKELFLGSNTEKVVRNSNVPVLVVKQEQEDVHFEDVVFATDFSEEAIEGYQRVMNFLSNFADKIHIVHVNTPYGDFQSSTEIENKVAHFLLKAEGNLDRLNSIHYIADYTVEKGILNFCNVVGSDLIAVITRGKKGLTHFFSGSVSEDVTNHALLPVIAFKM